MRIIIYFTLYLIFFASKAILANENLGEIVVSPNKSILQLDKTGASVLLIEKQQIDKWARKQIKRTTN